MPGHIGILADEAHLGLDAQPLRQRARSGLIRTHPDQDQRQWRSTMRPQRRAKIFVKSASGLSLNPASPS